jgi:hypothetical protein
MNDLTIPRFAVVAHNERVAGGSHLIAYGGMEVIAPDNDVKAAIEDLKNSSGDRAKIIASVNASLVANLPTVRARTASQKVALEFAHDLAIWLANEVIEGRVSLD